MKSFLKNKLGLTVGDLATIALVFVVAGISLGIGANVLSDIQASVNETEGGVGERGTLATQNVTEGISELASWMPTIGLVIAAAIIIGVIFSSFMKGR